MKESVENEFSDLLGDHMLFQSPLAPDEGTMNRNNNSNCSAGFYR